ncbi:MAG: P1 family peptidase [Phycisphaerae bacterium]
MKIALTYNLRTEETEQQSEMYREEEVQKLLDAIDSLGHEVIPVEVSRRPEEVVDEIWELDPDLVFNVAEGVPDQATAREAYWPAVFQQMHIPFTGGSASLMHVNLDKRLTEKLLSKRNVIVPQGVLLTRENSRLDGQVPMPVFIKPNYEGTSKGIHQNSVVEEEDQAQKLVDELLEEYPEGVEVEQFIPGKELTIPFLEDVPGQLLKIVEHDFSNAPGEHDIYDYELKQTDEGVEMICPARLDDEQREKVLALAHDALEAMPCPDFGRVDIRLHEDGTPYFLEINPIPRLMPDGSIVIAAREMGMEYAEILDHVIRSAATRYDLNVPARMPPAVRPDQARPSAREMGLTVGRFPTGKYNAITDVRGIEVGHVTQELDDVPSPDDPAKTTCIRTGVTAIVPHLDDLFNNHLVAGGFILNGVGEVSGLTQLMEWGWLETPILLTDTMSLGQIHAGIIRYMIDRHPELGRKVDVTIPIVAETDDSFLNDVRIPANRPEHAIEAIEKAQGGPVEQGSVGGGTGMITFDFAGGIGTSSRKLPDGHGGYTVGVLVQSNFGRMRNLTIEGDVVGKRLDKQIPRDIRQEDRYGSIIVVLATDAPLVSAQLNRVAKRAALGLGRAGSFAASTSGEIVFAVSTGNRASRLEKQQHRTVSLESLGDVHINPIYEAAVECTEEAVLNAIFCSRGQTGRHGRVAPALPTDIVCRMLAK